MNAIQYLEKHINFFPTGSVDWKTFIIERIACRPTLEIMHRFMEYGIHESCVKVFIWKHQWGNIVSIIDLGKGTSVTNAAEQLINEITALYIPKKDKTIWLEHYPESKTVDVIVPEMDARGNCYKTSWLHLAMIIE